MIDTITLQNQQNLLGAPPPQVPTVPLEEHDLNVDAAGMHNATTEGIWADVQAGLMEEQVPPAVPLSGMYPTNSPGHTSMMWGSSPTITDAPSSSPLSFDWSTPTPLGLRSTTDLLGGVRREEVRAGANTLSVASTARQQLLATQAEGTSTGPCRETFGNGGRGPPQIAGGMQTRNEGEASTDYFAFFATPPSLGDPSQVNQREGSGVPAGGAGAVAGAPNLPNANLNHPAATNSSTPASNTTMANAHGAMTEAVNTSANPGENPAEGTGANAATGMQDGHGEFSCAYPLEDDPRTARKRPWMGSPNPEDVQRGLRRPRRPGSTSRLRGGGGLPNAPSSASNPWRSAGVTKGTEWNGRRNGPGTTDPFAPIAMSTPLPFSVRYPDIRTQFGQQNEAHAHARRHGEVPVPNSSHPEPRTHASGPNDRGRAATTHDRSLPMDIDARGDGTDRDTPTPEHPKRDKGKRRATTHDLEPTGPEEASQRQDP
ncbi:hypothetical protein C8T65DRAFT_701233, partial [Cerioporus squamosus]